MYVDVAHVICTSITIIITNTTQLLSRRLSTQRNERKGQEKERKKE